MNGNSDRIFVSAPPPLQTALKYALSYAFVAITWIILSDQLVLQMTETDMDLSNQQTYKGLVFVVLTTVFLFGLIHCQFHRLSTGVEQLQKLESQIKTEHSRYVLLTEQSGLGVGFYDGDGCLQFLSKSALDRLGGELSDYIGRHVSEIFDDDTAKLILERFSALRGVSTPKVFVDQVTLNAKRHWFRSHYSVMRNETNVVTGLQIVSEDITEQMERERERQALLTQLQLAIETADLGIWSLNLRTGELYRNQQILNIYGLSEKDAGSFDEWQAQFHPEDKDYANSSVSQAIEDERVSETLFRIIRPDGEIRYVNATARPLHENGEIVKIFGINIDVTETIEKAAALRDSEQRYRNLVETSSDLIWSIDATGRITFMNEAARQIYGLEPDEMIGRLFSDFIPPDQIEKNAASWQTALDNRDRIRDFENWVLNKDGDRVLLSANAVLLRDQNGQVIGSTGVSRDITQQKETYRKAQFQSQLLQAVQQAVVATDLDGGIIFWNGFAERMYGWKASEVEGKLIGEITVPGISRANAEQIMSQISAEGGWSGEFTVTHKDGHTFPAFVTNSLFHDEHGDPAGIIGLSIDISERRKQLDALEASSNHLNAIFNASPAAIVVIDGDGYVKQWNPAAEVLFGWSVDEVIDRRFPILSDDKWDAFDLNVKRRKDIGGDTDRHITRQRKDGTLIDLSLSTTRFVGPDQELRLMLVYVDISERVALTGELEHTKNLLQRIFASLTEVVFVVDPSDRKIITCNPAVEVVFGYSPDEVIGANTVFLHTSPGACDAFGTASESVLEEQGAFSTEYQMRHKNGTILETEHTVTLLIPEVGLRGGVVSVIRDITIRKRALDQLQQSEQRYRELFENVPVSIWQQDFSKMRQYLQELNIAENDEIRDYLQTHPTALEECLRLTELREVNRTALNLYEAESRQEFVDHLEEVLRLEDESTRAVQISSMLAVASNKNRFEGEFVNWTLSGNRLVMLIRWIVLPGSENTYENVLVIGLDITERKRMEVQLQRESLKQKEIALQANALRETAEALVHSTRLLDGLRESEIHLATIINYSDLAVFKVDKFQLAPLRYRDHDTARSVTIYSEIQYDSFPTLHQALTIGHTVRLATVEDDQRLRSAFRLNDDLTDWIAIPLSSRDVTLGLLCVSMRHDTFSDAVLEILKTFSYQVASALDNFQVHLELQESYEKVERIQRKTIQAARLAAIGELAAGVAHQINNPLMTVIADSHLLLKHIEQDDPARESAEAIKRAAYRAGAIVQRLLDFARSSPDKMVRLDVNESLRGAMELIHPQIEPRYAQLQTRLAVDIPLIYGSEEHLQDVWMNLLLNARDAVREVGSGIVRVSTEYAPEKKQIIVAIEDNGVGIDEHIIDDIFDPFFTTKEHGTGLGLSICFDIVQQHYGTIEVERISSGGTRFVVRLPVK